MGAPGRVRRRWAGVPLRTRLVGLLLALVAVGQRAAADADPALRAAVRTFEQHVRQQERSAPNR